MAGACHGGADSKPSTLNVILRPSILHTESTNPPPYPHFPNFMTKHSQSDSPSRLLYPTCVLRKGIAPCTLPSLSLTHVERGAGLRVLHFRPRNPVPPVFGVEGLGVGEEATRQGGAFLWLAPAMEVATLDPEPRTLNPEP